ncbi:hypothetical protein AALP_AA4G133500 [Arabis alpina]|uniref:DUF7148 domain-containing protein n=1 Tax=Arabis alpina TaxID=50452 RepID=A0A087H308_ARAAL|nr:hypothetical protein AALP_AA4G133500 [Arabis alpina]
MALAAATLFFPAPVSLRSPAKFLRRASNHHLFLVTLTNGAASTRNSGRRQIKRPFIANASPVDEEGVSLGTMKLPLDTDVARFETLLFQWANSLCQGANIPLPVPLKVDRISGGARLGFIVMEDEGKTDVPVYIDCLVNQTADNGSGPVFRATRNGRKKDKAPPGEERIMRSLLGALKRAVEIARVT